MTICPCGNYAPKPKPNPRGGAPLCTACYLVARREVQANTRLNLRGRSKGGSAP